MLNKIKGIYQKLSFLKKLYPYLEKKSLKDDISNMVDFDYHISFDHTFIQNADYLSKLNQGLTSEEFRLKLENLFGENENVFIVTDPKKVEAIKKVLANEEFYIVTNPDKVEPAWMLENAPYQFFVFEYYDDKERCWAFNWWTNFPSPQAIEYSNYCIEWKKSQEDIEFEIKRILGPDSGFSK